LQNPTFFSVYINLVCDSQERIQKKTLKTPKKTAAGITLACQAVEPLFALFVYVCFFVVGEDSNPVIRVATGLES